VPKWDKIPPEDLSPTQMTDPGQFFNPWYPQALMIACWSGLVGLLLLWVHYRVNNAQVWRNLGYGFLAHGLVQLLFFRSKFPLLPGVVLEMAVLFVILTNLAVLIAVLAMEKLPYLGVEEKYLQKGDGTPRPEFLYGLTAAVFILPAFFLKAPYYFFRAALGHSSFFYWLFVLAAAGAGGWWSFHLLPWKKLGEVALLGEDRPPMELEKVFAVTGPATRAEVVVMALGAFLGYAAFFFIFQGDKKRQAADYLGLILMSAIAFQIIHAELMRSQGLPAAAVKKKSPWG
jgi:hypothetical protein